jgi:hypothetical protein
MGIPLSSLVLEKWKTPATKIDPRPGMVKANEAGKAGATKETCAAHRPASRAKPERKAIAPLLVPQCLDRIERRRPSRGPDAEYDADDGREEEGRGDR